MNCYLSTSGLPSGCCRATSLLYRRGTSVMTKTAPSWRLTFIAIKIRKRERPFMSVEEYITLSTLGPLKVTLTECVS